MFAFVYKLCITVLLSFIIAFTLLYTISDSIIRRLVPDRSQTRSSKCSVFISFFKKKLFY